ncbi:hypothetical protein [Amycolatopsis palatopharyngis]|uniref:hypothetical protein n=1 Tax=Amycolatopsis palatopharyngis TaxID=187982 RepID=UPI0013BE9A44|nr:hypothetical protein [Amycolatopsis palatopharyngis]
MHGHGPDDTPRCQVCQHKSRSAACARCGRVRTFNVSKADGKPYCRGCRARNHLEECAGCGSTRPVNVRDEDGRAFCGSCYAAHGMVPREACAACGTLAAVYRRRDDGTGVCSKCYRHPKRQCGVCGRVRRVALRATATSPDICPTCFQAPEITCSLCGDTTLGRRSTANGAPMCFRCQATQRVDAALVGPDGSIPAELKPVRDAIVSADNPRSILTNFTRSKSLALLNSIARSERPLSHDTLDEHAGAYSVEHLRALLVASGALPERDENLARLGRFVDDLAERAHAPVDRRLLRAFARWHVIARLRRRYPDRPVPPNSARRCRDGLTAALRFLEFFREQSRCLDDCHQSDIDVWFATQPAHVTTSSKAFLVWTRRHGTLSRSLTIPVAQGSQPKHFSPASDRWARARTLLHDDASASVPDRVAACLILLYAQPVTRIAALTTEHVQHGDGGAVRLRLGSAGLTVLPDLAQLLTQLPCEQPRGAARKLAHGRWLFPGRQPGHPLHPHSISRRVRALGVDPRPDRNTALLELVRELPPAVVGKLLGLHPGTAAKWAETAGSDWARYAAAHNRQR